MAIVIFKSDFGFATVIAVSYETSQWIGPRYNGTRHDILNINLLDSVEIDTAYQGLDSL